MAGSSAVAREALNKKSAVSQGVHWCYHTVTASRFQKPQSSLSRQSWVAPPGPDLGTFHPGGSRTLCPDPQTDATLAVR